MSTKLQSFADALSPELREARAENARLTIDLDYMARHANELSEFYRAALTRIAEFPQHDHLAMRRIAREALGKSVRQ